MDIMKKLDFYKKMKMIRSFEELILELFSQNEISGTTHTCLGQEAIAVASMIHLEKDDIVFSNHRCHGHYLAYGGPVEGLLAEIMTRENGVCGGRGGSQHLHYKRFYSNGIQGGIVPNATGMAWAEKIKGTDNIGVVFLGDGTLGQGVVYETMNMAGLYEIPILYIIENNQYAMTTKVSDGVSGEIIKRPEAFGIHTYYSDSCDVEELSDMFKDAQNYVRINKKPACFVVDTYRLGAHSKGDDTRDKDEIAEYKKKDPLKILEQQLSEDDVKIVGEEIDSYLQEILNKVKQMKSAELVHSVNRKTKQLSLCNVLNKENEKCLQQINKAIKDVMSEHDNIILIGEDIRDNYGGAFKVTKGISTLFDERVVNTPISEAGFTGIAVGLAMNGIIPIVEMMFGDFVTLTFDQIINHATKYQWVYGEDVKVPLVLRTPMGGGRGYGPTHSQSLEKHFLGIPGLEIMAGSPVHNNYELYKYAFDNLESPLQIVENKRMYGEPVMRLENGHIDKFIPRIIYEEKFPTVYLSLDDETKPDVTILVYGNITREVMKAAIEMMVEDEIQVDIVVVSQVYPLPVKDLKSILSNKSKIVTVEEGTLDAGWGSEVVACLVDEFGSIRCKRVAADNTPIANGKLLEEKQSVNSKKIKEAVRGIYYEK